MLLNLRRPNAPVINRLRMGTALDSYGDPVASWAVPDRLRLRGAEIQEAPAEEIEAPLADEIRATSVLFAPGAVDLTEFDRVEQGAEIWRVVGPPIVRTGLAMRTYTKARLARVTIT